MSKTGRNDPCPCGSGNKYKQCCAVAEKQSSQWLARAALAGFLVVLAVGLFLVVQATRRGLPEPYEYDAELNRYWDPDHEHWHDGAPPSGNQISPGGEPPPPWTYDATTDRHWNPDHQHWHDGRPPLNEAGAALSAAEAGLQAPLEPAPAQADPEPWEYDPVADRHWNPDSRAWVDGPPVSPDP